MKDWLASATRKHYAKPATPRQLLASLDLTREDVRVVNSILAEAGSKLRIDPRTKDVVPTALPKRAPPRRAKTPGKGRTRHASRKAD